MLEALQGCFHYVFPYLAGDALASVTAVNEAATSLIPIPAGIATTDGITSLNLTQVTREEGHQVTKSDMLHALSFLPPTRFAEIQALINSTKPWETFHLNGIEPADIRFLLTLPFEVSIHVIQGATYLTIGKHLGAYCILDFCHALATEESVHFHTHPPSLNACHDPSDSDYVYLTRMAIVKKASGYEAPTFAFVAHELGITVYTHPRTSGMMQYIEEEAQQSASKFHWYHDAILQRMIQDFEDVTGVAPSPTDGSYSSIYYQQAKMITYRVSWEDTAGISALIAHLQPG